MNILKEFETEAQDLVDENRQYEQRFSDFIAEMNTELHRLVLDCNGSIFAVLAAEKHESWGRNLELRVKTSAVNTSHPARIVQTGRGEYQLTDKIGHEETVRDGATALGTLLDWLTNRIKEQKGELAGGALTNRVFN